MDTQEPSFQVVHDCDGVLVLKCKLEHKVNELQTKLKQEHKESGQSEVAPGNVMQHLITCYSKRRESRLLSDIK